MLARLRAKKKGKEEEPPPPPPRPNFDKFPEVGKLAESNNEFTAESFKVIRTAIHINLAYSPFYLRNLMALTKIGARGQTAEEIQKVLHFSPDTDEILAKGIKKILASFAEDADSKGIHLSEFSAFFTKPGFEITDEFSEELLVAYNHEIYPIDFCSSAMAARIVNDWVKKRTDGNVRHIVKPGLINQYTRLLLINGIHVTGNFMDPFDRKLTVMEVFHVSPKKTIEVEMMNRKGEFLYEDFPDLNAHAISLPYEGDRFHLVIILPKAIDTIAMASFKNDLNPVAILARLGESKKNLEVKLPKFRIETNVHFIHHLKMLGVKSMFDPTAADFTGITGIPMDDFYMSEIIQKTIFRCAEDDGNELPPPPPPDPPEPKKKRKFGRSHPPMPFGGRKKKKKKEKTNKFYADHPFIFLFVDKQSGIILIAGTCSNPNLTPWPVPEGLTYYNF